MFRKILPTRADFIIVNFYDNARKFLRTYIYLYIYYTPQFSDFWAPLVFLSVKTLTSIFAQVHTWCRIYRTNEVTFFWISKASFLPLISSFLYTYCTPCALFKAGYFARTFNDRPFDHFILQTLCRNILDAVLFSNRDRIDVAQTQRLYSKWQWLREAKFEEGYEQ